MLGIGIPFPGFDFPDSHKRATPLYFDSNSKDLGSQSSVSRKGVIVIPEIELIEFRFPNPPSL